MSWWAVAIALAVVLIAAPPAAAMQLGVYDDSALVDGSYGPVDSWYQRARDMGASSIRTIATPRDLATGRVDGLLARAREQGFQVQLTLHPTDSWYPGHFDVAAFARFAGEAAVRWSVARLSVMNEPDLSLRDWTPTVDGVYWTVGHERHRRRYRARFRLIQRPGRGRPAIYRRVRSRRLHRFYAIRLARRGELSARTRRYMRRRHLRRAWRIRRFAYSARRDGWHRQARGVFYRTVFEAVYRAIKRVQPDVPVLAGEISPHGWDGFAQDFACTRPAEGSCAGLVADGFAAHPYYWGRPGDGIDGAAGQAAFVRRWLHTDLYYTEFGYMTRRRAGYLTPAEAAARAPFDIARARRAGVRELVWFHLAERPPALAWDTSLFHRDGTPRPAYLAIEADK
jgi:hypothetical protein